VSQKIDSVQEQAYSGRRSWHRYAMSPYTELPVIHTGWAASDLARAIQEVKVGLARAAPVHDFGQIAGEVQSIASVKQVDAVG